jgi:membrane protein YqaA with SNARE-associated domain
MKIPPKAMFISQLIATVTGSLFQYYIAQYIWESFGRDEKTWIDKDNHALGHQWNMISHTSEGWKSTGITTFLNAGAIWGGL